MRVLHVPFGYYPDPVGGTEVYVADLARALARRGVESAVAAPGVQPGTVRYEHDGVPVVRFPVAPATNVADLYGDGDEAAASMIGQVIREMDADVLHLHAFTRVASLLAAQEAKRSGAAVVFTYHTPTVSCVRGTMLHEGARPCDGALIAHRCAECLLESRGVPLPVRLTLSRAPLALGSALASAGAAGRWVTALRARELTTARHDAFKRMLHEADAIVAVCRWVRTLLIQAGAPVDRVALSRQGTPLRNKHWARPARERSGDTVRLAFVGRLDPTKGVHVVLRALADNPDLDVSFDIYGVAQDASAIAYRDELLRGTGSDVRVRFHDAVLAERVVETLASYDVTVVPSQLLETGPLVVLESFAAGTPVLGSNLGGIGELVTHDRDGWLVPYDDLRAWSNTLRRLATDRALLERLRAGVPRPRTTDDVASDMVALYERVVRRPSPHARPAAAMV